MEDDEQPMLTIFRTSDHLHTVALGSQIVSNHSSNILLALAENPNIATFCSNAFLPVHEFVHFLTSSQSVRNIELRSETLDGLELLVPEMRQQVAGALASVAKLEKLHVVFADAVNVGMFVALAETETRTILEHIFRSLGLLDTLRDLEVEGIMNCEAISHLRLHETTALGCFLLHTASLQSLSLASMLMRTDYSELLIDGLSGNRSVTRLSLSKCYFHDKTTQMLVVFFQTKANQNGNRVCDLFLQSNTFDCSSENKFRFQETSTLIPSFLLYSGLKSVHLGDEPIWEINMTRLFSELAEQRMHIRVSQLCLNGYGLTTMSVEALTTFLTTTVTLNDLRITSIPLECNSGQVLHALKQNSSLCSVTLLLQPQDDVSLFNEEEEARVKTYCSRNKRLPTMLAKALSDHVRTAATVGLNAPPQLTLVLLPYMIWVAAQQTPVTAPTMILRGLLSACETLVRRG